MKVLVTGGTGFVGEEILRQLHRAGHGVRVLVRDTGSKSSLRIRSEFEVELVQGNILEPATLDSFFAPGADAVIHLVGIISEIGRNTFEAVHLEGTKNVVAGALRHGLTRYVQMSALGTRADAVSRYHQSKWAAEEVVRQSGLDYTIFRPSIIYGPHDAFTTMFSKMARWSPVLPVIGPGEGTFQPIPVESVGEAFVKALVTPALIGRTVDLVGPDLLTMNELLDCILAATGRRRLKLHLPLGIALVMARLLGFVYPHVLRKAPPLNRDQIIMLQERIKGDNRLMEELTGVSVNGFKGGLQYLGS